ncbi:hypothetical protein SAPIO_CDS6144 [Scedosporium apiospermum]|uniref:Heterokaryon incompatibility domain-containing protein n=1 Tax=Pseudallescheria apiosperma TaxID=563466 RepID=A0A084G4M1_PSEDA|nr:uncharacterized protein SAPIO_CDS6144 [Scedosporium apiospermum]KEZ42283.1 hypothetical protein SAPIO_CDS6144 [Scedosporium apiospermum]
MTGAPPPEGFRAFPYQPLGKGEIRLLRLRQSQNAERHKEFVECAITHHNLYEGLEFAALSYVWGNDEAVVPITLNGAVMKIRPNLASFLDEARRRQDLLGANDLDVALDARRANASNPPPNLGPGSSEPLVGRPGSTTVDSHQPKNTPVRYIWIDALCIDQNNIPERNAQVAMMRDIYAKSSRIIIWLGSAADDSDCAMDMLGSGERKDMPGAVPALTALMQRPYWTRAWTQQEATTPEVPCEVWCGTKGVTYEEFRRMSDIVNTLHRRGIHGSRTIDVGKTLPHEVLGKIDSTKELRSTRDTRVAYNRSNTYTRIYRTEAAAQFGNLLVKYMHLEATDMRDRVYALIPIYEDLEKSHRRPVEVDYAVSAGEVFRRAMAWAINPERDQHLLMFCSARSRVGAQSWVVDFSKPPTMTPRFEDRRYLGKWGAGYWDLVRPEIHLVDEGLRLIVEGGEIASIADTYGPPLTSYDWIGQGGINVEQAAVWMEGVARFAFPEKKDVPYVSGTSTVAAMDGILSTGVGETAWPYFDLIAGMERTMGI